MADPLTNDQAFAATTYVVIDFETTTPAGHRPEPIEVAALAADGDRFLRGGCPATETLLLVAIKTYDYERHCLPALRDGCMVVEGRSLHSIAVYQSLILHPDSDDRALTEALEILRRSACWRPLPDVTLLITDDVATAIDRLQHRDAIRCSPAERDLHHRASALFARIAAADTAHIRAIDRRNADQDTVIGQMLSAVSQSRTDSPELR